MKIISLTLVSIGIILAEPQASAGQQVLGMKLAGPYSSATESECHVILKLCPIGKAEIVRTCRLEDGFRIDRIETTPATWSFDGSRIVVQYGCVKDVFAYALHNSYRELDPGQSGLALQQVEPVHSRSRLAGYGNLWREPLGNYRGTDPGSDSIIRSSAPRR
jgi:hypothetical protein